MITGARQVRMPNGKLVLQLYSLEWFTPQVIDYVELSQQEQISIVAHVDEDTGEYYKS